jgi:predicted AlkP superfamily pyrophosphatase or phosphodiesterase
MAPPPPLVVLLCVGLTPRHLGPRTPHLAALARDGFLAPMAPALPAVTTTAQTTMLTGVGPDRHGIVANGWYFRELGEAWLWRQSEALVQAPLVWQELRRRRPGFTVLKHFWWYAMNSSADLMVTPRPAYHQDGAKSPDFYAFPPELKARLARQHGLFPLFQFWGPATSIRSTRWIAESFVSACEHAQPHLALCYLPHLDYDLQRLGPEGAHLATNLAALDAEAGTVINHARARGARVLVVSEYGIEKAVGAAFPNRVLREAGLASVAANATGELLDLGASRAFAVCDHQFAHVYCRDGAAAALARERLARVPGVERVYAGDERREIGLEHPRSGELVLMAAPGHWFGHDWWLDERLAPDFARCVEIHKKPGYDPRELVFEPRGGRRRAAIALVRKKLGLRYVMDAITLDPSLVRGTHGRPPARQEDGPLVIGSEPAWRRDAITQAAVHDLILAACSP